MGSTAMARIASSLLQTILLCVYSLSSAQSPCCLSKVVGDAGYSLVESSLPVPGECKNTCVYTKDNDNSGHHFCFQAGSLPYECLEDAAPAINMMDGGLRSLPGVVRITSLCQELWL